MTAAETHRQLENAYRTMADRLDYRPAATSDSPTAMEQSMEATSYAADWLDERERALARVAGRPGDRERVAVVYAVEAVAALCEGRRDIAEELLDLAFTATAALRGED